MGQRPRQRQSGTKRHQIASLKQRRSVSNFFGAGKRSREFLSSGLTLHGIHPKSPQSLHTHTGYLAERLYVPEISSKLIFQDELIVKAGSTINCIVLWEHAHHSFDDTVTVVCQREPGQGLKFIFRWICAGSMSEKTYQSVCKIRV